MKISKMKKEVLVILAIDLGATHTRRGLVVIQKSGGCTRGMPYLLSPKKPKKIKNPKKFIPYHPKQEVTDLKAVLKKITKDLKILSRKIQKKYRYSFLKNLGVSAPGAWLEEEIPYKGTVPNLPDLENFKLAEELSRMMGHDWRVFVNNDGVANVLAMVRCLLCHQEKFAGLKEALQKGGKIAGFIPGTGFGAGAFDIRDGHITPIPGPQQFFDIIISKGKGRISPDFLTPEDLATGEGLEYQAKRNEVFLANFDKDKLTGEFIAALTEHPNLKIKKVAQLLYQKAGKALAQTMILTYEGGVKGKSRKAVVNNPPQLEAQFWEGVKGTRVFILGGWLTSWPAKNYTLPVLENELQDRNYHFEIVLADEIPGVKELLKNNSAGLIGAALLCPLPK